MFYDLVSIRQEIDTAVAGIPGTPATPLEEYYRYEETAAAVHEVKFMEFGANQNDKLCELKAMELNVVLDFEG